MSYLAQLFVNALHLASEEELQRTMNDESLMLGTRTLAANELERRSSLRSQAPDERG